MGVKFVRSFYTIKNRISHTTTGLIICLVLVVVVGFLSNIYISWSLFVFLQKPEFTLGGIALLFSLMLWVRDYSGIRGVMAMVDRRNPQHNEQTTTKRSKAFTGIYWVLFFIIVFLIVQFFFGASKSYREYINTQDSNVRIENELKTLIDSNTKLQTTIQEEQDETQIIIQKLIDSQTITNSSINALIEEIQNNVATK